jgi:transposase-like protein/DNA-binding Lrp family transcriptional regulator
MLERYIEEGTTPPPAWGFNPTPDQGIQRGCPRRARPKRRQRPARDTVLGSVERDHFDRLCVKKENMEEADPPKPLTRTPHLDQEAGSSGRVSDETKREMYRMYADGGTLESVGRRYNVTRERIRQNLEDGSARGLFVYPIPKPTPRDVETMLDAYREELALSRVATRFGMTRLALTKWMAENGVLPNDLERVALEGRKNRAFGEYMALVEQLGTHPTTTILQREHRALSGAIDRHWGDFRSFRLEFDIPAPALGNPNIREDIARWTERQKQLGLEHRRTLLAEILNCLTEKGPQTFNELRENVSGGELLVREVLVRAQDDGLIERFGGGRQVRYRAPLISSASAEIVVPELRIYQNRVSAFALSLSPPADPIARLKALDRRRQGHAMLCDLIAATVQEGGLRCEDSDYIDLLVARKILIEVKTLEDDDVDQVRAALGQLLYYRFAYRSHINDPILIAAFSHRPYLPIGDAIEFLGESGVHAVWLSDGQLLGTEGAMTALGLFTEGPCRSS